VRKSRIVECTEPRGRPLRVSLSLSDSWTFCVYLLPDALDSERGLRATVLRPANEDPPPGALLVLELRLSSDMVGLSSFRVLRVGRQLQVEQIRPEVRSRVVADTEVRAGSRVEVTLPDMRRFEFSVHLASQLVQDVQASVGGSGLSRSRVLSTSSGALWLVPTIWNVTADWYSWTVNNLRSLASRLGLSTRMIGLIMMVGVLMVGFGLAYYIKYQETVTAQEEMAEAQDALTRAEAAQQAAILSELACLDERQGLIDQLGDSQARMALMAEQSLSISAARTAAREMGGARMGSDEALAFDEQAVGPLKAQVVSGMAGVGDLPDLSDQARCLYQQGSISQDLPTYALVWHPDPEQICPSNYRSNLNGVELVGRWGLSDRVVAQFGGTTPISDAGVDPRADDRWSAQTLSTGLRTIQKSLLGADVIERPPVLPSQSQLWSLAIFSAYARMPMTPEGVLDQGAEDCVEGLVLDLASVANQSAPGEPLLPDISAVADGVVTVPAKPTPGCPWPPSAMLDGARASMKAAATLALINAQEEAVR